ncbi:MAG: ROK family protein [Verrucomicrobiota bacterium]
MPLEDRRRHRKQSKHHRILDTLRKEGALSKIQVRRATGYSMSTVLDAFDSLTRRHLIKPVQVHATEKTHGRKAAPYALRETAHPGIGFTFNRLGLFTVITGLSGAVLARMTTPLPATLNRARFLKIVTEHWQALRVQHPALCRKPAFVAAALPGEIDPLRGVLCHYSLMPSLGEVDFRSIIEANFPNARLVFDSNVTGFLLHAISDKELCGKHRRVMLVSMRAGLSIGTLVDGEIDNVHGSLDHIKVGREAIRCACGRTGCLGTQFSHEALEQLVQRFDGTADPLSAGEICARYRNGPPKLKTLIDARFALLGEAVLDAINLWAPNLVVFTGELFACYDDPAAKLKALITADSGDRDLSPNLSRTRFAYLDFPTEAAALGLCHRVLRDDFPYADE